MKLFSAAVLMVVPAIASAQPDSDTGRLGRAVPEVPSGTFEVAVATGYAQGGGKLGGALGSLEDVAGPGAAVDVGVGYRIVPQLALGVYGTLSASQRGDLIDRGTNVIGGAAGIQAAWHLRPGVSVDPWISVGGGWRGLWLEPDAGKVTSLQGFDVARLQLGVDYRITREIAIAPVIGGSATLFVSQDSPMTTGYTEIADKKVNFTGFVGLSGRFDFGSTAHDREIARNDAITGSWQ